MLEYVYLIRWDRVETFGVDFVDVCVDGFGRYVYVKQLRLSRGGRGISCTELEIEAISFCSWAEAAACAAFIIHHIDDQYEDALEVVKVEL